MFTSFATRLRFLVVAVIASVALQYGAAHAAEKSETVYRKTLRSTALIATPDGHGTGWVVDKQKKWLITAEHVVRDATQVRITFPAYRDGKVISDRSYYEAQENSVAGRVLRTDEERDLALIQVEKLPEGAGELKLASEVLEPGEAVHSVGCPARSTGLWVYSHGQVRQVNDVRLAGGRLTRVVETQIPINPGDSGGPLVNDAGELVGVNHALRRDAQLVSLSIDAAEVKQFLAAKGNAVAKKKGVPDLLLEADEAKRARNWKLAEQKLTEALKLDPRNVNVWCQLAWVLNEVRAYEDAELAALAALAIDEKCSFAWRELGFARMQLKEWDNALRALVLAIKCDPTNWTAYDSAAIVLRKLGEDDLADQLMEKKLDLQLRLKD